MNRGLWKDIGIFILLILHIEGVQNIVCWFLKLTWHSSHKPAVVVDNSQPISLL
jgi:hypothetical protein